MVWKGSVANSMAREQAAEEQGSCAGALCCQPPVGTPCRLRSGEAQGLFLTHFSSSFSLGSRPEYH